MSWLTQIKGWVLDVDGCLVRTSRPGGAGGNAIPGAVEFVTALKQAGHRVLVCTNASERPPLVYADHLRELGFPIADEDFVTAGSAGADHIAAHHPGATVVAVGGDGITWPLLERGLSLCDGRTPQECAAVLVGALTAPHAPPVLIPAHEAPDRRAALEELQACLGAEEYERALARGASMSYEDIVGFTLAELDRALVARRLPDGE